MNLLRSRLGSTTCMVKAAGVTKVGEREGKDPPKSRYVFFGGVAARPGVTALIGRRFAIVKTYFDVAHKRIARNAVGRG